MHEDFEEGFIMSGGAELHYHSYGEGVAFVMLHGNMQDQSSFDKQVAYFRNKFRVVSIDSRGHGESTFGEKHLSIDVMADDVVHMMDQLKIQKAILLGFSDGGNIALKLALKQPERLIALVAVGANLHPGGLKPMVRIVANIFYQISGYLAFIGFFNRLKQRLFLIVREPAIAEEELAVMHVPTLLVAGQYDLIKEVHTRKLAALIPNAKLEIVKGGGHLLLKKKPYEINLLISRFLNSVL